MDCRKWRILISREIDGESADAARYELERHLASCEACRGFRERVRSMSTLHRSMTEFAPGARLVASILAEAGRKRERSRMHRWVRFALPAAAAAVFLLGFWIGSLMHEQYRGEPASIAATGTEALDLDYLDECPPGSFGYILTTSYGGGGYETGRP